MAKLAGVPESVTNRAKEIVEELSHADITSRIKDIAVAGQAGTRVTRNVFAGDRQQVRWAATEKALSMVKEYLEEV